MSEDALARLQKSAEYFQLNDVDIAFLLGITKSYWSRIKNGRRPCAPLNDTISSLMWFLDDTDPDLSIKYSELNNNGGVSKEGRHRRQELLKELKKEFNANGK